jgi:hypothetical protein
MMTRTQVVISIYIAVFFKAAVSCLDDYFIYIDIQEPGFGIYKGTFYKLPITIYFLRFQLFI